MFAVELLAVFILVCLLLHRHGNVRTLHPAVTASVLIAWWFSFVIVFVVPMDVSDVSFSGLSAVFFGISRCWELISG